MKQPLAVLTAALLWSVAAAAATPADTIVVAKQIDQFVSLDPAEAFEPGTGEVLQNLYDALLTYRGADDSTIVGALAESWSVAADGVTYSIVLKPGLKFASGNPVTAADAAYSLRRAVILNKSPGFILTQFGFSKDNAAERIRAADARTLVLVTDRPVAPTFFYNCLTANVAMVVDAREVQAHEQAGDFGNAWLKLASAGTGPYKLRSWKPGESVTLDANPNWHDGAPKVAHVAFRHVAEATGERLLLEKGDVDIARDLSAEQLTAVAANPDLAVDKVGLDTTYYLGLNLKNPNLARPDVREAMKWLVDYGAIERNIVAGTLVARQTILPAGYLGAIDDQPYRLDVARAKALLAKAGLADGFSVTMDTRSVTPLTEIAQAIQGTMAAAGIKLEILPGDGKQTLTKYRARTHDIYIGSWGSDYRDPHSNAEAFASNPDNGESPKAKTLAWRNAWSDPELTRTVASAVQEQDPAIRARAYQQLQRDVLARGPYIVMFQQVDVTVRRKSVSGLVIRPTASYAGVVKRPG